MILLNVEYPLYLAFQTLNNQKIKVGLKKDMKTNELLLADLAKKASKIIKKLKVYSDDVHPHEAQNPEVIS